MNKNVSKYYKMFEYINNSYKNVKSMKKCRIPQKMPFMK